MPMGRLGDLIRRGVAEIGGWIDEREQLQEAAADGRMFQRQLETLGWTDIAGGTLENYFEPDRGTREQQIERAYRYFFTDPIIRRSVKIRTNYVFRKGVPLPRYREDQAGGDTDDQGQAQELIRRFWEDEENRAALTAKRAQREKNDELTVQGNVFFLMFRQEGEAPDTPLGSASDYARAEIGPPTMKVTDLRSREIVDVITHPANRKIPIYYKRVYRQRVARFERGRTSSPLDASYDETETQPQVRYYRDWRFEPPQDGELFDGEPWRNPPAELVEPVGRVYHVKINCTSDMRFGLTDLQAALKWAQGLNQYMTSRMQVAQAIAAIALQAKTKGGPTAVRQVVGHLRNIQRLDGAPIGCTPPARGSDHRWYERGDQGRTRAAATNHGASLEPMVQDTGAAGAQIDTQIFKGQIAAATGVPVHQLGDSPTTGLSTLAALDGPLQAECEDVQDDWETVLKDIVGYMLAGEGFDPRRVVVKMPPILMRDVQSTASMLLSAMSVFDPNGSNRELQRWVMAQILDMLGDHDAQAVLELIFPAGFETPHEQRQKEMSTLATMPGGPPLDGRPGGPHERRQSPAQIAARTMRKAADAAQVARNQGLRGIPPPGESLDRAQRRVELAREQRS
jgi:hypothetical protein